MKVEHLKKLPVALLSALMVLGSASPALAASTNPYFKAYGADIMTGGWFDIPDPSRGNICSIYYQHPNSVDTRTGYTQHPETGGILAFAKTRAPGTRAGGGASSEFAAMAIGIIQNNLRRHSPPSTATWGLYSSGATSATAPGPTMATLSFANIGLNAAWGAWGGGFDGNFTHVPDNCIPDYFAKEDSLNPTHVAPGPLSNYASDGGIFHIDSNSGAFDLGSFAAPNGKKTVVFVNGPVYIGSNITYAGNDTESVPKFTLVVKGSIYIAPGVDRLDGLYIAQPDQNKVRGIGVPYEGAYTDNGNIWTCQDAQGDFDYIQIARQCQSKLTINGALIAKEIDLTRVQGNLGAAAATVGEISTSDNIAEAITFTPAMIMGGGFFEDPSGDTQPKIDSLISLPPVF